MTNIGPAGASKITEKIIPAITDIIPHNHAILYGFFSFNAY